jgi:hypothetical protein
VELGFRAGAVGGSGFMGWIRENVELGFCAGGVGGSGFMGWIRGNVESGFCAGAAARWSGALTRSGNRALGAARMAGRRFARRRHGGMIARMVRGVMLSEGMGIREDSG